ncbi:MAG: TetR/AcrR family transcriptional regulator [bacterium]|nr:TetR/AcrR family transcriptional regulator [bacterium]MCP4964266.1 TetR/AcrR family transcriptional regulator [bacterium]
MGRPKMYDREGITDRAMNLFWERGYHATSTRDLTEAMGVNPYSLYAEFGSKQGLYSAAVERYESTVMVGHFGGLEAEDASLEEIRDVLDFFGESGDRKGSYRGCLLCNASTELAPTLETSRESTARYVEYLITVFTNALRNAANQDRLVEAAPIDELAAFFATVLMGQFVMMRAQVDRAVVRSAANQVVVRLNEVVLSPDSRPPQRA